jgi:hypothetical protein
LDLVADRRFAHYPSFRSSGLLSLAELYANRNGRYEFPAFKAMGYSYDNTNEGVNSWNGWRSSFLESFYFRLSFQNPEKTQVRFDPVFLRIPGPPLQNFSMVYIRDGYWERRSTFAANPVRLNFTQVPIDEGNYPVYRVVNADGSINQPIFDEFVKFNFARSKTNTMLLGRKRSPADFLRICF